MSCYAGRIKFFYKNWQKITDNVTILNWVRGYKLQFTKTPKQHKLRQTNIKIDSTRFKKSLEHLLKIGAVRSCISHKNQIISPYFLREKPNGESRFILNLKNLNKYIVPTHFKLEDYRTAKNLITQNCFMASIDLKDAYFLLPIHSTHTKYLRFVVQDFLYEFTCLPFGLCSAPYLFTKIFKPIISHLRSLGYLSTIYLDDILLFGRTQDECSKNVQFTSSLLEQLGFIINSTKSNLSPCQNIKFLGFLFNSEKMTMKLPDKKSSNILKQINSIKNKKRVKIRQFARLIGSLVAACPAVPYGWLYTKKLERQKTLALIKSKGNFNKIMNISVNLQEDFIWWIKNLEHAEISLTTPKYELEIFSDASLTGWGVACNNESANGFWDKDQLSLHINNLELLAAWYGLKIFAKLKQNCHILLRIDNITAVSLINKMGSSRYTNLNNVSRLIWQWCEAKQILIFASYIRSKENLIADFNSRVKNVNTEYSLNTTHFNNIVKLYGKPDLDLFASRQNTKCKMFASWKKDPDAFFIDAFTRSWENFQFYAFPPFSLLSKVLCKIEHDKAEGIVVFPLWKTQPWFPKLNRLRISDIYIMKPNYYLLLSPSSDPHPLWKQLTLGACKLSGKLSRNKTLKTLQ